MKDYKAAYMSIHKCVEEMKKLGILKRDDNGNDKIPPGLVGYAGELYAMHVLRRFEPTWRGGGYDIELMNGKKIEIRSSTLKHERSLKNISVWGWRLQNRKGKYLIPLKYDRVICIKFKDGLANPECYVFTPSFVKKVGKVSPFPKVARKIWLYRNSNDMKYASSQRKDLVTSSEIEFNKKQKKYLLRNNLHLMR